MSATKIWLVLGALFVLSFNVQAAKLYKWVDKDGNVSYQDSPPPTDRGVEERDLPTAPGPSVAEKSPVILYSVTACQSCDLVRAYLKKRKVPFTEKNVESDAALQKEMKQKTGALSVPAIMIGNKVMRGYVESELDGELDQAGYPKAESTQQPASAQQ